MRGPQKADGSSRIFKNLTIILIAYGEVFMFNGILTGLTLCSFALMASDLPASRHGIALTCLRLAPPSSQRGPISPPPSTSQPRRARLRAPLSAG